MLTDCRLNVYTYGYSDVISIQLAFAAILWVKLSYMFSTVIALKYALLAR